MSVARRWACLLAGTFALAGAGACDRAAGYDAHTAQGRAALQARGDTLVAALERFRAARGRYPRRLAEAGVPPAPIDHAYGGWDYGPCPAGDCYGLRLGDYGRDGFVLYREPRDRRWVWDT